MARITKEHGGVSYVLDDELDYSNAIKEAEAAGDYEYAGALERSRNAKIDGEGLSYAKTYKYSNPDGSMKSLGGSSSGGYSSQYGGTIGNMLSKIMNREEFDYDYTKDDSYKALEEVYKANGKYAMQDTLGDAAALTGGRASSAAVSASQQAYNRYMQQLAENIPALEQAAYARYRDEGNELYNQMNLLQGLDDRDYSRYIDDRNYNYQLERDAISDERYETEWNYKLGRDAISDQRYETEWNYKLGRDAISDERYIDEIKYNRTQDAKNEAFEVAAMTGDYSKLLECDYSQETVDALNAAHAKGVAKEEMDLALQRAQIAAQYGDFSGFTEAGFSEETVAQMKAYWDKGQLTEDALVAAQFGDYSKLSELGITPKVETKTGGDDYTEDYSYWDLLELVENGDISLENLKNEKDGYKQYVNDKEYYQLLEAATKYHENEMETRQNILSEKIDNVIAQLDSGLVTKAALERNSTYYIKLLGQEGYDKVLKHAGGY